MSQLVRSEGIQIARQVALLGAESILKTNPDVVVVADTGWTVEAERWQQLGAWMRSHETANPPARAAVVQKLGLQSLDYWLLCFVLAAELYPDAAAALSIVAEDERLYLPTPLSFAQLMQAALGDQFVAALQAALEGGRLGELGLVVPVEPLPGRSISHRGLRIAAGEFKALLADHDLAGVPSGVVLQWLAPAPTIIFPPIFVQGTAILLTEQGSLWLRAPSARVGRQLALDLATALGVKVAYLKLTQEMPRVADVARIRESLLAVDLFAFENSRDTPLAWLEQVREVLPRLVVIAPKSLEAGSFPAISGPKLGAPEVKRVWDTVPLEAAARAELAARFQLTLVELQAVLGEADNTRRLSGNPESAPDSPLTIGAIVQALRTQGARAMGKVVTHIDTAAHLDQLVVPPPLKEKLTDMISWRQVSLQVYDQMQVNLGSHMSRGLIGLFSGPPGTGKTFAAQCVANALGLNLYRVDLSQVVSKYIGETEKSLAQIFDEAEAGHGVLLFDEADALFGKRSEVKDAHDRYANIEVGYLLQRIETFDGMLILATNLRNNIDLAFLRRIQFLLDFPMPDRDMRIQLWQQSLPAHPFRDSELDIAPFAEQFRLSGGSIRNIAVAAAHLAAVAEPRQINTAHLTRATYRELEKNGQSRTKIDFGSLADFLSEDTWATSR
jgi:hypothetical protein